MTVQGFYIGVIITDEKTHHGQMMHSVLPIPVIEAKGSFPEPLERSFFLLFAAEFDSEEELPNLYISIGGPDNVRFRQAIKYKVAGPKGSDWVRTTTIVQLKNWNLTCMGEHVAQLYEQGKEQPIMTQRFTVIPIT